MSTPPFPFGMDPESLRDAPLFRELQRVMSSSSGPVQWELARQLAVAGAAEAGADPEPAGSARAGLEEALRVAELQVADFTGLEPANDLLRVQLARRADWIAGAIEAYRPLVESAATRLQDTLARAMLEQLPADAETEQPLAALGLGSPEELIRQLGPLLQATQIGQVFGFLAARVLGDHDVGIPRAAAGPIGFVLTNIERVESDWSLDPREFRTFVALHQVVHRLQSERPWLPTYAATIVDDFLSTMTIDVDAIQQRFASLAPADPESLQAAFGGEDDAMFGVVLDDEQRLKLDRIRALVGAVEGHGDHVATTIGARLLGTYPRIEEAMRRHRDDEDLDPLFARLLGVDVGREHVELGRRFCETVVELTDEATLTRMWADAEALPGLAELEEPRLWLARTV
ncbi:MAG TPA: zinc-dependent metalloprotease [Actinomycetota bacterium]|nr:zinc-dependent metalloprotease [Actinomycetota bacterium]